VQSDDQLTEAESSDKQSEEDEELAVVMHCRDAGTDRGCVIVGGLYSIFAEEY